MIITGRVTDSSGAVATTSVEAFQSGAVSTIPLTYNDPRFASNVAWSGGAIANNAVVTQKSYNSTSSGDSTCGNYGGGNFTLDRVRINSRECVRIGAPGTYLVQDCYLEANGQGADHADGIQCYAPGATGNLTIRNTCIKMGSTAATAGLFWADDFAGTLTMENVCFNGGPYGFRVYAQNGRTVNVYLTDVFVVGTNIEVRGVGGTVRVRKWQNVRSATIVNGAIVLGALIPSPYTVTP